MPISSTQIAAALDAIRERISKAAQSFDRYASAADEWSGSSAEWYLEVAYTQLITLAEALQLLVLRAEIAETFAKAQQEGLLAEVQDPDGSPYPKWAAPLRRYVAAIQTTFATDAARTVTKDLESIIRAATYSITDRKVFESPPQDETAVHLRLENVLRCVFPGLLHKPRLAKPIKNFEPDTDIPSIRTLIEYKFLARAEQSPKIADELLADTRGYISPEWDSFTYVIYETERFRSESEWRQLLRACGVDSNTVVVVISGQPVGS